MMIVSSQACSGFSQCHPYYWLRKNSFYSFMSIVSIFCSNSQQLTYPFLKATAIVLSA